MKLWGRRPKSTGVYWELVFNLLSEEREELKAGAVVAIGSLVRRSGSRKKP
jgi:hypothetical protein